jgi:hypothetical protein
VRETCGVKATGLQGDASPEIIEVIDDDTDAFGDRAPNTTLLDSGGPRWVGPVAAGVLVAVMGYGVATSASSSSAPKVAPITSTTVVSTTSRPTPSTTVALPAVPYYAADPPRQFTLRSVDFQEPGRPSFGRDGYELWATVGASATSGSWFSITADRGTSALSATDAYRVQTDELSIAISHTSGGHATTHFSLHARLVNDPPARVDVAVTITSFGWSDDDLVRLAASIDTNRRGVGLTDPLLASDHQMISSVPPSLAVQGNPAEQISYVSSADPSTDVLISVAQRPPPNEGGATLDRQIALRFFLDRNTPFEVDDHAALAGALVGQSDYSLATWIAGDDIVTVGGAMPVPQLIAIARTVHEVSADEWEGMSFQARRNNNDSNSNFERGESHPLSSGDDADSNPWKIHVAISTYGVRRQINWSWGESGGETKPADTAQINTVVEGERTFVLADLPRAIAPTADLHVQRDGLDPVIVPFNDVDPESDRTFAAYAFSEPVPYTAQIIGPDAAVLATWPSP